MENKTEDLEKEITNKGLKKESNELTMEEIQFLKTLIPSKSEEKNNNPEVPKEFQKEPTTINFKSILVEQVSNSFKRGSLLIKKYKEREK